MLAQDYLKAILRSPVYQVAIKTPLHQAKRLSQRMKRSVYLKREDLQPDLFSFKLRGAFNKMVKLTAAERHRGVVAASAGNHAQGVAISAHKLNIKAQIVMPITTPQIKVESVRSYGVETILQGDSYDEAFAYAQTLVKTTGAVFIPPFDDPAIIAGQGTVALELFEQLEKSLEAIYVPVGGGGLLAGMAVYVKSVYPDVKVYGVEPDDAACLKASMAQGKRVCLDQVGIFVDGASVKQLGQHNWDLIQSRIDGVITVTSDEVCSAIRDIFEDTRSIAEPAGALAVAGLKKHLAQNSDIQSAAAVVSGANTNFDRLRYIAERAQIGEQKEALYCIEIPEEPGSFRAFCEALGKRDITEFNYRYAPGKVARVFVGVTFSKGESEREKMMIQLSAKGYKLFDLSQDELAKNHVRYMVGGRVSELEDERLFRFEFPERPRALLNFLQTTGSRWNISLFHYRNHGSAFGRVLVGIQVPKQDDSTFQSYLLTLGYPYVEETNNEAYHAFLK